jgi:hypothetical protein
LGHMGQLLVEVDRVQLGDEGGAQDLFVNGIPFFTLSSLMGMVDTRAS